MSDVFEILVETVSVIFNFTVDVVFFGLLLVSFLAPWRWPEVVALYEENGSDWRRFCGENLIYTIADFICMPMALFGILSPQRWLGTVDIIAQFFVCDIKYLKNRSGEHRMFAAGTIFLTLADIFAYLCFFIGMMSPLGGQVTMFVCLARAFSTIDFNNRDDDMRFNADIDLDCIMMYSAYGAIMDLICFVIAAIGLVIPTTWPAVYCGYQDFFAHSSIPVSADTSTMRHLKNRMKAAKKLRKNIMWSCVRGILDMFMFPFWILAILSPYRFPEMRTIIETQILQRNVNVNVDNNAQNTNYNHNYDFSDLGHFDYRYDIHVRIQAAKLGFLALADLLLFPMIGLLYVTQYRYGVVQRSLQRAQGAGLDEAGVVAKQFLFLCLDCVYLPTCGLLLYLTQYRILPVREIMKNPSWVERDNLVLYFTLWQQTFFLCMDMLTLPLICILLCSGMRSKDVYSIVTNPQCRVSGLYMNIAILIHMLILIHDVSLLTPCILCTCVLGPHRVMVMAREVSRVWEEERRVARDGGGEE
ncbi:hypothetical protein EON65_52320, partial [archaeon]